MTLFTPAVKRQMKARIALCGPAGSGKTWTALELASDLGEKIALVDTEFGSASLYADRFAFDVLRFDPPFLPEKLVEAIREAATIYDVLIIDSLSAFWEGEGGVLDIAENSATRSGGGNSFAGWRIATPIHKRLITSLLAADLHLIATMRSKTEWVIEQNSKGKQAPRKVGLAPIQRQGVDYEFTLVCDMDLDHRIVVSKSRCPEVADKVYPAHSQGDLAAVFSSWLNSGEEYQPEDMPDMTSPEARLAPFLELQARAGLTRNDIGDAVGLVTKGRTRDPREAKPDEREQALEVLAQIEADAEVEKAIDAERSDEAIAEAVAE